VGDLHLRRPMYVDDCLTARTVGSAVTIPVMRSRSRVMRSARRGRAHCRTRMIHYHRRRWYNCNLTYHDWCRNHFFDYCRLCKHHRTWRRKQSINQPDYSSGKIKTVITLVMVMPMRSCHCFRNCDRCQHERCTGKNQYSRLHNYTFLLVVIKLFAVVDPCSGIRDSIILTTDWSVLLL
jgi:hypothetical protein